MKVNRRKTTLCLVAMGYILMFSTLQTVSGQSVIQSVIVNNFDGLGHGKFYELQNGQIWKQTEYWIWVWIWVNPKVFIYQDGGVWNMKVENIDHAVTVERIR